MIRQSRNVLASAVADMRAAELDDETIAEVLVYGGIEEADRLRGALGLSDRQYRRALVRHQKLVRRALES